MEGWYGNLNLMIFFNFAVFVLGLCVGSFLNVLIYRLPKNLGFVKGRSFCPKCKHKLTWFDNIPLLSFLILKGRCRCCGKTISWKYPIVELLTGAVFLLSYLSNLSCLSYLLFAGLIVVFFIDLEHQIIPDEIVIPFSLFFLIYFLVVNPNLLITNYLIAGFFSFLFLYFIYLITKGKGMGFGDVKLAFLMGLVLGWPKIIVAFYLAFLTGAIIGIILILLKKSKLKQKIAFGPFLCLGTIIAYLWGEQIIKIFFKYL